MIDFSFLTFSSALLCGASTFLFSTPLLLMMRWWWWWYYFSLPLFCYKERRWQRSVRSTLILIVDLKDKTGTETWWRTERFTWVPFNFCDRDSFKAESTFFFFFSFLCLISTDLEIWEKKWRDIRKSTVLFYYSYWQTLVKDSWCTLETNNSKMTQIMQSIFILCTSHRFGK